MGCIVKTLESAIPITALIAISLFIVREILDLIKSKRKSARSKRALKMLLSYELELNFWSLKHFFNLIKNLSEYEALNEITLEIKKGIETNYTVKITEKRTDAFSGQAVPPFHFDRFEKLILSIGELGNASYEKLQKAYSCLNELDDYRIQALNLFGNTEWMDNPDLTFSFLSRKSREYEQYYQSLNSAYKALTGNELSKHRLD